MQPTLNLRRASDHARIDVTRSGDLSDSIWVRIQGQWGDDADSYLRGTAISIPLSRLLGDRMWLVTLAKAHGLTVEIDEPTTAVLSRAILDRQQLSSVLSGGEEPIEPETSGRFIRDLRPFQQRDLKKLANLPNGANFSVPGAGKTTVTYALYDSERGAGRVNRLLVVAPLSAFEAWQEEAIECFDTLPIIHEFHGTPIPPDAEVVLVNYHRLTSSFPTLAVWVDTAPTHVVLDEAHRMKRGWDGQWGAACLSLGYLAERRDVLTGTPAPQSPRDLEAIMDFLWPNQARRILPSDALRGRTLPVIGRQVAAAIQPLFTRTTKNELGLPETRLRSETVPLEGLHREIYMALRRVFTERYTIHLRDRRAFSEMGEIVMYLLEAATNPALLVSGSSPSDPISFRHPPLAIPDDVPLADLLQDYATYETPAKFIRLAQLVQANAEQGRKTLIWTNFVRNIETLKRVLAALEPAIVHGGIPTLTSAGLTPRTDELQRFREDPSCLVLIANPAALSEGVSLHHACHDAIYLDRTFNAGQYLQSLDRIHRLGLPAGQETRITFLLTEDTIDEVVDDRVRTKAELLGTMLDDDSIVAMALPDDEDYGHPVEGDVDIAALFAHLRGDLDA